LARIACIAIESLNVLPENFKHPDKVKSDTSQILINLLHTIIKETFTHHKSILRKIQNHPSDILCWIYIGYCYKVACSHNTSSVETWLKDYCTRALSLITELKWISLEKASEHPTYLSIVFSALSEQSRNYYLSSKKRKILFKDPEVINFVFFPWGQTLTANHFLIILKNSPTIKTVLTIQEWMKFHSDLVERDIKIKEITQGKDVSTTGTGPLIDYFRYSTPDQAKRLLIYIRNNIPCDLFQGLCNCTEEVNPSLDNIPPSVFIERVFCALKDDLDHNDFSNCDSVANHYINLLVKVFGHIYKDHQATLTDQVKKTVNHNFKFIVSFIEANNLVLEDSTKDPIIDWYNLIKTRAEGPGNVHE